MKRKMPGSNLKGKPVQGLEGAWHDRHGKRIRFQEKDLTYSGKFWEKKSGGLKKDLKQAMMTNIEKAGKEGELHLFVGQKGIALDDKEKLSAYRVLAQQMGYEISEYKYNKGADTVTAKIRKKE